MESNAATNPPNTPPTQSPNDVPVCPVLPDRAEDCARKLRVRVIRPGAKDGIVGGEPGEPGARSPSVRAPAHSGQCPPNYSARRIPSRANTDNTASTIDNVSTAVKSLTNSDSTPTPTTGTIRPQ